MRGTGIYIYEREFGCFFEIVIKNDKVSFVRICPNSVKAQKLRESKVKYGFVDKKG
jgi:hypothetical protein